MSSYIGKINLLKFTDAKVINDSNGEKGIFIPIEKNHLFISKDPLGNDKYVFYNFIASELKEGKYGESHWIKLSIPNIVRDKMTNEEKEKTCYLGSMRVLENRGKPTPKQIHQAKAKTSVNKLSTEDNLPF